MKKSRYRIVQYGDNMFKPEVKGWFFWWSILETYSGYSSLCPSLESAKEAIEIYERNKQYPKVVYEGN